MVSIIEDCLTVRAKDQMDWTRFKNIGSSFSHALEQTRTDKVQMHASGQTHTALVNLIQQAYTRSSPDMDMIGTSGVSSHHVCNPELFGLAIMASMIIQLVSAKRLFMISFAQAVRRSRLLILCFDIWGLLSTSSRVSFVICLSSVDSHRGCHIYCLQGAKTIREEFCRISGSG